jgi:hypothetical protein
MTTRFHAFLIANRVMLRDVARETGYSRQLLRQLRRTGFEPARHAMARITDAVSRILKRPVYAAELFPLGEMDEAFAVSRGVTDEE